MPSRASATSHTRSGWERLARSSGLAWPASARVVVVVLIGDAVLSRGQCPWGSVVVSVVEAVPVGGGAAQHRAASGVVGGAVERHGGDVGPCLSVAGAQQDDRPVAGDHGAVGTEPVDGGGDVG